MFIIVMGLLSSYIAIAQNENLEKTIWGIQLDTGFDFYNETKLANNLSLRAEAGLAMTVSNEFLFLIVPSGLVPKVALESRYYTNFGRRQKLGKNTAGNSANFIYARDEYRADWFEIPFDEPLTFADSHVFSFGYGLHRQYGDHFSLGITIGLSYISFTGDIDPDFFNDYVPIIAFKSEQDSWALDNGITLSYRF